MPYSLPQRSMPLDTPAYSLVDDATVLNSGQNAANDERRTRRNQVGQAPDTASLSVNSPARGDAAEFEHYLGRVEEIYEQLLAAHAAGQSAPFAAQRSGSMSTKEPALMPVSMVTSAYFSEYFRLEHPRIFDMVTGKSEIHRPSSATAGKGAQPRQKKLARLSLYTDIIEAHLAQAVSESSVLFATALSSLQELGADASRAVDIIQRMREALRAVDESLVGDGLTALQKRRRLENI
ncbi:hypothetical protein NLG97_g8735 [Lecanicillium saksenae]|uniref:Uncharacterized protein n=1 Tax=Lecanicillium saksenae TaxID=468837 RepID=A0ACC1QLX6_9HYPO|nr:hypothetical protein NLG97_g8735 [Lecanicillium saksenae]